MGLVRGCYFPDDHYYNVDNNVWAHRSPKGAVKIGITSYACQLTGKILACSPKRFGVELRKNQSCATIESGKWVGTVKAPIAGEVIEVNDMVLANPSLISDDPYGDGWLIRLRPFQWEEDISDLLKGIEACEAFEARMIEDGYGGY